MSVEPAPVAPVSSPSATRRRRARFTASTLEQAHLSWPGKGASEVVPLDRPSGVSGRTWRLVPRDAAGDPRSLVIVGDSANALPVLCDGTSLVPSITGQVKLAYLDPPFNTGSRFEHYNDAVGTAEWLTSLQSRLRDIKKLLHRDGSVWLHLNDSEQHHGRCLLDEIFGPKAFVATIIWQRRTSRDNRTAFSAAHDYIHVYAPAGAKAWKTVRNGVPDEGAFYNPDDDPRGSWRSVPLSAQAGHGTPSQFYSIRSPSGAVLDPPPGRCWTYTAPRFQQLVADGRVYWPRAGAGRPRLKRFQSESADLAPFTIWLADEVGDNAEAKKELMRLVPSPTPFDTPKPERLMKQIIRIATDPGDLVLDCYLGSGTTASAAEQLGRRWIGIEVVRKTVESIVVPRLMAVGGGQTSDATGTVGTKVTIPGFAVLDVRR